MSSDFTKKCVVEIGTKHNCCRVCLNTRFASGINLEKSHILDLLEYCVGFKVDIQHTSYVLCEKCKGKIEEFAEFKAQFIKTELLWKQSPALLKLKSEEGQHDKDVIPKTLIKEEKTVTDSEDINSESFTEISYEDEKSSQEINKIDQSPVIDGKLNTVCSNKYKRENHCDVKCNDDAKTYKCTKCKRKYNNYTGLLKHKHKKICCKEKSNKLKTESKVSTNECGICDKPYSDLKEHMKQHWLSNDLECELCNYHGKDFAHMITHRYTHYPQMKLYCVACDKRSFSMLALQFHFRSLHLQRPGGFCTFCDKTFEKFKTWKRHHRIHTESYKLYVCDHCGYKFLYRHEMKAHMATHMETRQYVCEACGKGFKRISSLRDHIYNIHETRKPVTCNHCNKVYKCENQLKIHQRNITTEKPFVCEVCSKQYPTEKVLKKHMFWHTGERPFSCEVCGSKYKAKAQLKVHMRKHSGTLPYTCVNCGKNFACSAQLKRHKSIHNGVRAHKCAHCEKSFHLKKHLLEHAAQHKIVEGAKLET